MFTHSLRWRLQMWLAFLLVAVLSGFGVSVYQLQRVNQFKQIDEELERRVVVLSSALRRGPPPEFGRGPRSEGGPGQLEFEGDPRGPHPMPGRPGILPPGSPREMHWRPRDFKLSAEAANLFDETRSNGFYFAAWSRSGIPLKSSANAPVDLGIPERADDTLNHTRMRGIYREAFHFTEMGDCVLAGHSITSESKAMAHFRWWLFAAGGTVLAFGLGGGWWLSTRAIRPVEEISAAASRISAGNLSERIAGADPESELGRLAGVLNSTFARLETAFAQQAQFTADASHELRTPLAILISEAQTTLARERSAAEYRETIEASLDTAQQMRRLTESLLELARLDASQEPLQRESVDVAEVARACVEKIRPLAKQSGVEIDCKLERAETLGHSGHLGQVLTNLLANAIHYNKPNGEVRVRTAVEGGVVLVTVADTGIGIGAEDIPHIFQRFYRADKSRARAQGRVGLGLAICKAMVEAHGGSIEVSSKPEAGTTFSVRLPASPKCRG
jgi:heavy metal sensor kinase